VHKEISGIIPPLLTCFKEDGGFDEAAQRSLVEFFVTRVDGLYPVGTYGCGLLMSAEERKRVAETVLDQVRGRIPVIIHIGAADTATCVDLAKHAESAGADAVAAIAPYYYKYSEAEIVEHFRTIASSVKIPFFAYNNPHTSGNAISPRALAEMASLGVAGVKDSAFDLVNFYSYLIKVRRPGFTFIVGTEAIANAAVMAGAAGVVSGLANVWPELMRELWGALKAGCHDEASALQLKVVEARAALKIAATIPSCYAVLKMRGIECGWGPRRPYLPLGPAEAEKVRAEFVRLGLLKD
jgi:N-acetylneuraminate lyase/4-hydroxy-tetrahydrodipicolinate synthase